MDKALKFRRRKTERPKEIIEAAAEVFAEKGFASAKIADIAECAGVTKGTLYLYYETKEALFEAVVKSFASSPVSELRTFIEQFGGPFNELLQQLPVAIVERVGQTSIPSVARMVIGEARNFPELAQVWHSQILAPLLSAFSDRVRTAQNSGEMIKGDPERYSFLIVSPMIMGMLLRDVLGPSFAVAGKLNELAEEHGRTLVQGMLPVDKPLRSTRSR